MKNPDYFISCDWGTSNFRLRLVNTKSLDVLAEIKTDQGIKVLHRKFLEQNQVNQSDFFKNYLSSEIDNLNGSQKAGLVVIAGMASSNIGMLELAYGDIPFNIKGEGLNWETIPFQNDLDILLISGIKDQLDMMRGEEMQAFGLAKHLEPYQNGVLILPGTHSKHITYESGAFTALKSFMTGELFELLSDKSILANNVEKSAWSKDAKKAFKAGLQIGFKRELSAHLFSIRARHLLHNRSKKENFYMLSGMLIGDELAYLKNTSGTIFLAAQGAFYDLYQFALEIILAKNQVVTFGESMLEKALLIAQKKIIDVHGK